MWREEELVESPPVDALIYIDVNAVAVEDEEDRVPSASDLPSLAGEADLQLSPPRGEVVGNNLSVNVNLHTPRDSMSEADRDSSSLHALLDNFMLRG